MFYTEQVETLLKNQELTDQNKDTSRRDSTLVFVPDTTQQALPNAGGTTGKSSISFSESISPGPEPISPVPDAFPTNDPNAGGGDFPWEVIGLDLDEPLPPQDVVNDL